MAKAKTTKKLPAKPFTGKEGNTFSSDNQPSPDLKKAGWERWRAKKMLTQKLIEHFGNGKNLDEYIKSLIINAQLGNAKAIEAINSRLEEEISKSEVTVKIGKELADERYV